MKLRRLPGLAALLFLLIMAARAEVITPYDARSLLDIGQLVELELPGDSGARLEYLFTPPANGLYGVWLFGVTDKPDASAELWEDDALLAAGAGETQLIAERLSAGHQYVLKLFGTGHALLEVSREALSRSFSQPMALEDSYTKRIARVGDAHWYAIESDADCAALFSCTPQDRGLRLSAWVFSEEGTLLSRGEALSSGTVVSSLRLDAGTRLLVRVADQGKSVGSYTAKLATEAGGATPQSVRLSARQLDMNGREVASLQVELLPEDACSLLLVDSSAPEVAVADGAGHVISGEAGRAALTVYAWGGARSTCIVDVTRVSVEDVFFLEEALTLEVGDTTTPTVGITPVNATERGVRWFTLDPSVATVSENGTLEAVATGETDVVVETVDGRLVARLPVTVTPAQPRHRALLIGEQDYAETVEQPREGSVRSVTGVMSLLRTCSFGQDRYAITTVMDVSRDGALAALRKNFASAREEDTSLIYITCHGFYQAGMTFFLMVDGSVLSAADLERELRQIPGTIILIADCCGSGGLIDASGDADAMLRGILGVFTGAKGGQTIHGDRYKVIVSACLEQDSYRVGFEKDGDVDMATVFARALCDAGGWSLEENSRAAMKADMDYDGGITLDELRTYLAKRVMWYLGQAGDYAQSVCVWPEGDTTLVFERSVGE